MPALAAVAGADVVLIALVAMLLAVALFPLFRPLLEGALSSVPVIGDWLSSNVDTLLFRAYVAALGFVSQAVQPLADFLARVRWAMVLLPDATVNAVYSAWWAIGRIHWYTFPQFEALMKGYIDYWTNRSFALAYWVLNQATTLAAQVLYTGERYTDYWANQAYALAYWVWAQSQLLVRQLSTRVDMGLRQAEADARAGDRASEEYARTLATAGVAYTITAVLGAERYAQQVGAAAEDYAGLLQRQALDYTRLLTGVVAAAGAAATAAVAARVERLEDSPCQRTCGPLGELGGLLQGLEDAGLVALLLGLAAEAHHDPAAVATMLRQDVLPVAQGTLSAVQARL